MGASNHSQGDTKSVLMIGRATTRLITFILAIPSTRVLEKLIMSKEIKGANRALLIANTLHFHKSMASKGISENILQLAYQQRTVFSDLAEKLSQPGSPKAHILLVGDHAPPFIDPGDHKMYDEQLVPYIELVPNQ